MRVLLILGSALAAGVATLHALGVLMDALEVDAPPSRIAIVKRLDQSRSRLEQQLRQAPNTRRIAFLGDSTVVGYERPHGPPERLAKHLRRLDRGTNYHVVRFGFSGMFAPAFYHSADFVLAGQPDAVVMIFNPVALGTQLQKKFALPELAGWTPPGELFEAIRLPFHRIGLSLDEMLLYMGIVQIGLQAEWIEATQAQLRIVTGLESALSAANGPRRHRISAEARGMLLPGVTPTRGTVRAITAKYGDALEGVEPDHDFIRIFAAAVALYREAGAQVVVYVVPINYEHFDKMGVWNGAGMRKTVDSLRRAVETAGGTVVDLHQLIPDVGFMDAAGHHTVAPPYHGPDLIARELAPIVISLIDDSRKRGR